MIGSELCTFSFWWIVPVVMVLLCFFMMRRCRGSMMRGFGCCNRDWQRAGDTASADDILDRRYASGDIDRTQYEEKKRMISGMVAADTVENKPNEGNPR